MPLTVPNLDDRTYGDLVEEAVAILPRYAPGWTNHNASDPGITIIELLAYFTDHFLYRLNRVTKETKLRFLQLLSGVEGHGTREGALLSAEQVDRELQQVVRDLRIQLGVSRATLEHRAKVGTDYLKHLEGGRHPSVEATRLRRVVGVLQQAAAREKLSTQLNARLARVVKAITPSNKAMEKRSAPARKPSKRS